MNIILLSSLSNWYSVNTRNLTFISMFAEKFDIKHENVSKYNIIINRNNYKIHLGITIITIFTIN